MARGIALVFVAGFLTLVAVLASAFACWSAAARDAAGASGARASAARAAESALAYTESRLWEDPRSTRDKGLPLKPENARDDWTVRGKEPADASPATLLNPSYARGDPWRDLDADGAYTAADALTVKDADGNGRFTVRSGRLRDGPEFSLRIASAEGAVCVNSGEIGSPTDDHDQDGILDKDDPEYEADSDGNGIPDWKDPAFSGNRHLVRLLDNLGAILEIAEPQTADYAPGYPQLGKIQTSSLGARVVAARPRGGYASVDDLEGVLGPADHAVAAPYLATHGRVVAVPAGKDAMGAYAEATVSPLASPRYEHHAAIDFNRAPLEVIQANLRWITASGIGPPFTSPPITVTTLTPFVRLRQAEADRVAEKLAAARPIATWPQFLMALHAAYAADLTLSQDDPFTKLDLSAGIEGPVDESLPYWTLLKQDLVLARVMPETYFADPQTWRMNGLEVDRTASTQPGGEATAVRRILKRFLDLPALASAPFDMDGNRPAILLYSQMIREIPGYGTTEFFLDGARGPGAVAVRAEGRIIGENASARIAGTLHLDNGSVRLDGQQDLELRGVTAASPWRYPGGAVLAREDTTQQDDVDTWPRFPMDSYAADPQGSGNTWVEQNDRYPPTDGGLRLAAVQTEDLDFPCTFALPFNRDPTVAPPDRWYTTQNSGSGVSKVFASAIDNLGDPVGAGFATRRSPDPVNPLQQIHEGYRTGTMGPRFPANGPAAFDWPQGQWPAIPVALDADNRVREATLVAWVPRQSPLMWHPGGTILPSIGIERKFIDPATGSIVFAPCPRLELRPTALQITAWKQDPDLVSVVSWDADTQRTPWRHLAVVIEEPGPLARVYVDGNLVKVLTLGEIPVDNTLRVACMAPVDDLRLFAKPLDAGTIRALAAEHRFRKKGTFTSALFTVDPDALPHGAVLRGLSWDGFVPQLTRGSFRFDLLGYADGAGSSPLNPSDTDPGRDIPWNGSGTAAAFFGLPGTASFRVKVGIDASDPVPIEIGGVKVPVLRDSPHLSSLTVHYATRPRWSGLAGR